MEGAIILALGLAALILLAPHGVRRVIDKETRVKRQLAQRGRTLVRDVNEGLVCISGRAKAAADLVEAPLSRRECLAYDVVIEARRYHIDLPIRQHGLRPFVVDDGTGVAWIDADTPYTLALAPHRRASTGPLGVAPQSELQALQALIGSETLLAGVKYSESVLTEGSMVSVLGNALREVTPDGERQAPRQPPERVVLRGTADHPLLIAHWDTRKG